MTRPDEFAPRTGSAPSLEDRFAVHDLFMLYAEALDDRRWELLDEVFTDDVTSDWPTGHAMTSRAEMVEHIRIHLDRVGPTHHLFGNFTASMAGDAIHASVRMRAYHSGKGDRADLFEESLGSFLGRAVPTPAGWRLDWFEETIAVILGSYDVFDLPGRLSTESAAEQ